MLLIFIVVALLTIFILGGAARLLMFFRHDPSTWPKSERMLTREKVLALSAANIFLSVFGLISVFKGFFGPLETLIGVFLVTSLMEFAFKRGRARSKI